MFSSSSMGHGLLGDITMVCSLPRRNIMPTGSNAAPPAIAGMDVHSKDSLASDRLYTTMSKTGKLKWRAATKSGPRRRTASGLNLLERNCYMERATNDPKFDPTPEPDSSMWTPSGAIEAIPRSKSVTACNAHGAMGDGTGEGREARVQWQPIYQDFDSSLLERRMLQSGIQMQARSIKNRVRRTCRPSTEAPASTLIRSSTRSEGTLVPPGDEDKDETVYVRHYGSTRNWPNMETGIFEGSAASSGTIGSVAKPTAAEFGSSARLLGQRAVHCRSDLPLNQKYSKPVTEAQIVGWDLSTAEWHDNQQFPRQRSSFVRQWHDLKKGAVAEHLVRRCKGLKA